MEITIYLSAIKVITSFFIALFFGVIAYDSIRAKKFVDEIGTAHFSKSFLYQSFVFFICFGIWILFGIFFFTFSYEKLNFQILDIISILGGIALIFLFFTTNELIEEFHKTIEDKYKFITIFLFIGVFISSAITLILSYFDYFPFLMSFISSFFYISYISMLFMRLRHYITVIREGAFGESMHYSSFGYLFIVITSVTDFRLLYYLLEKNNSLSDVNSLLLLLSTSVSVLLMFMVYLIYHAFQKLIVNLRSIYS